MVSAGQGLAGRNESFGRELKSAERFLAGHWMIRPGRVWRPVIFLGAVAAVIFWVSTMWFQPNKPFAADGPSTVFVGVEFG